MSIILTRPGELALGNKYPASWAEFIGQTTAVHQLSVAAKSAKLRGEPLPHCLLASGSAGIGKTALAMLVAQEMKVAVAAVSGAITVGAARYLFSAMGDSDILFIDEAHLLVVGGKAKAEWLLNYMQDGIIAGPQGAEVQPKVTIIAATTEAGRFPETILDRFPLKPVLTAYTDDEGALIALQMALKALPFDLPHISLDNAQAIAAAGNNNPRKISALLAQLRDLALVEDKHWNAEIRSYDLTDTLQMQGLTEDGLNLTARHYLTALLTDFPDGAGMTAIKDRLQEPGGLAYVERILVDKAFIAKTKQGRQLTAAGIRRARDLIKEGT
jgi:Holliday junction DNA helicase RuvB